MVKHADKTSIIFLLFHHKSPFFCKGGMLLNEVLLLVGIVIMICILLGRFAENLPVPSLLVYPAHGTPLQESHRIRVGDSPKHHYNRLSAQ